MNRATMMQLVDALNKAVASGDRGSMFRRADELERYFYETVLDVFKDFDAAWMRFKMAESMVAFLVSIGEVGQAVVLRNRIIGHYQHIRKLKGYTASQKHELKTILGRIRAVMPPVSWRERYGHRPLNDEERQQIFVLRAYRWFAEVHKMLPKEGMKYLKPFGIEPFLFSLPITMPRSQVVKEMTQFCYERGGTLAPRHLQKHYHVNGNPAK